MSPSEPVTVLVVEDDRAIQRMLHDALAKQGFSVTVERDGAWAERTFKKRRFDLVLLDLVLPTIDGYELAGRLRALPGGQSVPLVFLSGIYRGAAREVDVVKKFNAAALLEKPVRLARLYETLKSILGDRYPQPRKPPLGAPIEQEATTIGLQDPVAQAERTYVESLDEADPLDAGTMGGDLAGTPFPSVLADLYRSRAAGALFLRRDSARKIVYFRQGLPLSVKSNLLSECLGQVLVREKMISEADCQASLTRMRSSGRLQGTVLIEMGCISPHNLVHALKLQLQAKLLEVFAWTSGDYRLSPHAQLPTDTVGLDSPLAELIYEGVRRYYDEVRLASALGDVSSQYAHPVRHPLFELKDLGLGEEEEQLLAAVDGHRTVATLRALSILSPVDTDRLLFAMSCAQMVTFKDQASSGRPKPILPKPIPESPPRPPPLPPPAPRSTAPSMPARPIEPLPMPWDTAPTESAPPGAGRQRPKAPSPPRPRVAGPLLPELLPKRKSGPSTKEGPLRERLARKATELQKQDYFQMLGVSTDADREQIKRAYFALAKEYHPDKHFGAASAEVRQLAQRIYELISLAHDTLTDPGEKERYLRELAAGVKRDVGDEVGKILAAEGRFQRGEELLRQRNLQGALEHFRAAVQLYSEEGEFHAYLGWTHFQFDPHSQKNVELALSALERATQLNPKLDKCYLFSGYIYKTLGQHSAAERQFEKAIQCNPDCTEALRELRLLGKTRR